MARSTSTSSWGSSSSTGHSESKSRSRTDSQSRSESRSRSESQSQSSTKRVLDEGLLDSILSGLSGQMTDEEIAQYAENLLKPQLNAQLEASQQAYEASKLGHEQEIENLAAALTRSIDEQNSAYRQSMSNVETAALSRGMGRSSYTMQTLANQGDALAASVRALTEESARQQGQIQQQITQSAQQNAQTQGRLNADYETNLAAKVQELRRQRDQERNNQYLTAMSSSMGSETNEKSSQTGLQSTQSSGTQETTGATVTDSTENTTSSGGSYSSNGSSGGSGKSASADAGSSSAGSGVNRSKKSTSRLRS